MPAQDLKKLLERIHLRLDESFVGISSMVSDLAPADLAELFNQLTVPETAAVVAMLPVQRTIEVFDQPTMRRRAAILEELEPTRGAEILAGLSADERTDIIQKMGQHERHRIVPKLAPEMRTELEDLLQYPVSTAGGIMTTEFVHLDLKMTVGEALKHIRSVAREKESIYACYVIEPQTEHLLGAVSLRDLVMAELDAPINEVMRHKPVTVNALDDQEAVAQKIGKYNLLAVPVLEQDGSVVGFVTVDDVIDVLIEEQTEDILRMAGVEPGALDKPYFDNPIFRVVRKRIGWLMLLFVAGTLTSAVLHRFEAELAAVVALSFFIPLLIGTGGNAGAQTVMTVIRSLALGEIGLQHAWRVVLREATTGMVIGLMVAPIAFGQALLWEASVALALTVSVTMFAICIWSTTVGSLIPILAERFGVDPAVLSAPLITTLVDATGLIIYFTIAKMILHL
ncbi:MAG: magnesium transporter [Pyrinomonadaceae bacterium]|nr:magnesium transporter [Pyrinomonadaceae bacterium]MDQ3175880.1 magnesium transporter [Acidobacteriota bacterium]